MARPMPELAPVRKIFFNGVNVSSEGRFLGGCERALKRMALPWYRWFRRRVERPTLSSPPIRVALDARYVREKPSGIGTYVQALVARVPALAPADHFTFWAHLLAERPLSRAANTAEFTVRPGPNSPLTIWWPEHYASFREIDVFHGPHNLLPRKIPCPSVVTVHDVMALERPKLHLRGWERIAKGVYYPQAVRRALEHATRLIAPSQATADCICALVPSAASRLHVILEAADAPFRPAKDLVVARARAASLLGGEWPYLLVVGANVPSKRHDLALAAFAAAVPRPWRLVLLQRRLKSDRLVQIARSLQIEERIVWRNAVRPQDVITLLQGAGALIQPSVYEGFGLPVLEAMACGCPVIASDIAPFREITAGAARLVPMEQPNELAAALREVVESAELRQSLRERGLSQAKNFSWDRCARETLEVYHDAANAGSPGG